MKIVFMRRLQELAKPSQHYFLVDFDFIADAKGRDSFYKALRVLLGKPLRNFTLTHSVIGVSSQTLAQQIYELAVEHGARDACLRLAHTLKIHHSEDAKTQANNCSPR